jgi:hypothetical protein
VKISFLDLSAEAQLYVRAMELAVATSLATERHAAQLLRAARAPETTLAKAKDICQRAGVRARALQVALDRAVILIEK